MTEQMIEREQKPPILTFTISKENLDNIAYFLRDRAAEFEFVARGKSIRMLSERIGRIAQNCMRKNETSATIDLYYPVEAILMTVVLMARRRYLNHKLFDYAQTEREEEGRERLGGPLREVEALIENHFTRFEISQPEKTKE